MELPRVGFEAAAVTYRAYQTLQDGLELVPTTEEVERLRWVKSAEEVGRIEAAQGIADEAFEAVVGKLSEGMTEHDVALELDFTMRRLGADDVAFEPIVAFGENAAEPHHPPAGRPLVRGDMVKLDFGALLDGYHTDMTRTVGFGDPDPRLVQIHELVLRAQQAGMDAVRAGVRAGDVDAAARSVIEEAGHGEHYPHSLGHGVGLQVHEGPMLRSGSDAEVPQGAVVTIEPGVYVPGLGGVRIEDMVEVTAGGCRPIPTTPRGLVIV
jgi:Xaa-Pro aminopeptidase/Xaa-Pro dipeptidase